MRFQMLIWAAWVVSLSACSPSSGFKGSVAQRNAGKTLEAAPEPAKQPIKEAPPEKVIDQIDSALTPDTGDLPAVEKPVAAPEVAITLEVRTSAPEVRAGRNPIQAEAILSSPVPSKIIWSLEGAPGVDLGSIDAMGKYLSPAKASAELLVTIVATLEADPKVVGKKSIKVIPVEQLFVGCKKGNLTFPITADVFKLPANTPKLPDFSTLKRDDVVCLDKYDIPLQSWERGFPGAPALQEWFALHSKAKLVIAKAGIYEFRLTSDDGSKLYINNAMIIDNDGTHQVTSKEGQLSLNAGKHDIVVDYFQGPRTEVALQLFWKVPGTANFVIVPSSAFSEM